MAQIQTTTTKCFVHINNTMEPRCIMEDNNVPVARHSKKKTQYDDALVWTIIQLQSPLSMAQGEQYSTLCH